MDSVLEQQRRIHEERERLIDSMVREWLHEKKTHKERINSDHRLKLLLDMNELIEDPERVETDMIEFSDEEGYGRFLDLHLVFEKYLNLKGVKRIDYVTYLTVFDRLFEIPKDTKKTTDYKRYLEAISKYLTDFINRTRPLLDLTEELSKSTEHFAEQWSQGTFPGWPKEQIGALSHQGVFLDLSPFNSWEELKPTGLERLKSALIAQGLKCGGTLEERARRLFETKGKRPSEMDASLFAAKTAATTTTPAGLKEEQRQRDLALVEAQIYAMVEMLGEERLATKDNVERKQARTAGEMEEEEEEEEAANAGSDDDDGGDDVPYNPKNLPLGWDGKPIPYWLYKLHGLNISYPCEICGNQIYKGPKAFQRHFSEWRHSHGMRCLGIPNTAHFANITKIADAIELWQTIREQKETRRFRPETDEEYEDSLGNVVNRKTYEDLKRQGLL